MLSISLILPLITHAQDRQLAQEEITQKRVALVIGNGNYVNARKLVNPVNDANDMAKALTDVGFEVISGTNLSLKQMTEKVREFGDKLKASGGVGLFYYAGHGIQVNSRNYLIPVEADISREDEIDFAALNFDIVLRKMATANNGLNIVILDACRNNPFARSWNRGEEEGGLAQINAPTGTFIAYATSPDKTASDGTGRNGLYTAELLKFIKQPNMKIEETFKEVRKAVKQASGDKQIPWDSSSLSGEFYFKTDKSTIAKTVTNNQTTETMITAKTKAEQEKEAWDLVKNSASASDFRYYLEEFPSGANAAAAKIRLEELIWQTVRGSDKAKIQAYLNEFPSGANASAARIRIKQLEESANVTTNPTPTSNNSTNRTAGAISKATLPGGVEMSFAYIPAGSFEMGRAEPNSMTNFRENPGHTVKISREFWMQTTEVTQAQWKAIMGALPSKCDYGKLKGLFLGDNKPIVCVSWDDAQKFVSQMNLKNDGYKYRLPTEAEWEYAARAGTTGDYAGDLDSMAWYYKNAGDQILSGEWNEDKVESNNNRTHDVGTKQANAWGLYDMHGNVWEWCQDWYGSYPSGTVTDPTGATSGSRRVLRGGTWHLTAEGLRSAVRFFDKPSHRDVREGFRVVRQ